MGWPRWQMLLFPDPSPLRASWDELVDPSLPIVEVGPGRGDTTVALAEAFPDARIIAVEPDAEYRALLVAALLRAGVADRVEVQPCTIAHATLPARVGGIVAGGVLYFLSPDERLAFWRRAAEHLAPGCCVVSEGGGHGPGAREDAEPRLLQEREVDGARWQRWFTKRALADGRVELINTMRAFRGDEQVGEEVDLSECWSGEDRRADIEAAVPGAFEVSETEQSDDFGALLVARRR